MLALVCLFCCCCWTETNTLSLFPLFLIVPTGRTDLRPVSHSRHEGRVLSLPRDQAKRHALTFDLLHRLHSALPILLERLRHELHEYRNWQFVHARAQLQVRLPLLLVPLDFQLYNYLFLLQVLLEGYIEKEINQKAIKYA